ncbi:MAG: DNA repair protein RecN, partial [Fimbriimonadaceae bacterium]
MITEISVKNLAIISRATVRLNPGLTCITGETGAGKSLLVDAVELVLGARAQAGLIRTGEDSCTVRAVFEPKDTPLEEVELEDDLLILSRELTASGKSTARMQDQTVPLSRLKQAGAMLVDLHGQHEHQMLFDEKLHIQIFDLWAGEDVLRRKREVERLYKAWQTAQKALGQLQESAANLEKEIDQLKFEIDELEAFSVQIGEFDQLQQELKRLQSFEALQQGLVLCLEELKGEEFGALDKLRRAGHQLRSLRQMDESLEQLAGSLENLSIEATGVAAEVERQLYQLDASPERLNQVSERVDGYKKLFRKYAPTDTELLEYWETAATRLDQLQNLTTAVDQATAETTKAEAELNAAAADLGTTRRYYSPKFAETVQGLLPRLSLPSASFAVELTQKPPATDGTDQLRFLFTANKGEPLKPLANVASGGENSRLMLAIKSALSGKAGVPTMI